MYTKSEPSRQYDYFKAKLKLLSETINQVQQCMLKVTLPKHHYLLSLTYSRKQEKEIVVAQILVIFFYTLTINYQNYIR